MDALAALTVLILGAGGLIVDTESPDALCPPLAPTREIVAARLGSVELEGTWRATYVLVHRNAGDFVILNLRDPAGVLRLERELPVQGTCSTLSLMMALILERFFLRPASELPADGAPVAPLDAAPPAPPTPARPLPAPSSAPIAPDARDEPSGSMKAASAKRDSPAFRLDAGLWWTNAWLSPSARLARHVAGPYDLALSAGVDLQDHETTAAEGSVAVRRFPVSLMGTGRLSLGRLVSSTLSVELLGLFEQAWTRGLASTGGGLRLVPGVGLRAGADFLGSARAGPFVELTSTLLFGSASGTFRVDRQAVAEPPDLAVGAAFGLRTSLY